MAEQQSEQPKNDGIEGGGGTTADAPGGATPDATAGVGPVGSDAESVERRQFVRRMGTNAIGMAGTVFGLSRMVSRGVMAAGEAVATELGGMSGEGQPVVDQGLIDAGVAMEPVGGSSVEVVQAGVGAEAEAVTGSGAAVAQPTAVVGPATAAPPAPGLALDSDQAVLLQSATSAVVAVNRAGFPPQLTTASVFWDGETIRFATLGWSRRATMLRTDPLIGFLVEGEDGRFVTVTGSARIVDGRDARAAMWPLLLRETGGAEDLAEARWHELAGADPDRAVIVVAPDQVLTGHR